MREHLIVVVPGIGGSVLAPPAGGDPVWSVSVRDAGLLRHPERLDLAAAPDLVPVGLITSLKVTPFWTAVDGYERLVGALGSNGDGVGDPSVLAVPYDFRRSIVESARLLDGRVRERLWTLWPGGDHRDRVIVVAHSMGGLVARYWLAPGFPADEREPRDRNQPAAVELCRALVTLGTPHRGAPKALDILANGIRVKGFQLRGLSRMLAAWPSMAELLPRYPAVLDGRNPLLAEAGTMRYPHEVAGPWQAAAKAAYAVHEAIDRAWDALPASVRPEVVPRIGYGHATLRRSVWDGTRVTVTRDAPAWPDLKLWSADLGDGTVPAVSGLPLEMDRHRPANLLVPARHGQLGALDTIRALVDGYEGRPVLRAIRGDEHPDEHPPVLGLDLDELHAAGEPFDIVATVHGAAPAPAATVTATLRDAGTDRRQGDPVALRWDGDAYRARLPGLPPGAYRVKVSAPEMPGVGALSAREAIGVFDDDELA